MARRDRPGRSTKKLPKKERAAKLQSTSVLPSPVTVEVIKTKGKKETEEGR